MLNINQELRIIELEEVLKLKNTELKECRRVIIDLSLEVEELKKWNCLLKKIIRRKGIRNLCND